MNNDVVTPNVDTFSTLPEELRTMLTKWCRHRVGQPLLSRVFCRTGCQQNSVLQSDFLSWNSNKVNFVNVLRECETALYGYNARYLVHYPGIYVKAML